MSCYQCGKWGHKRDRCPQRMAKIQCYACGQNGHYKNDCPVLIEQARKEKEARIAEEERLWVLKNVPNQEKLLKNHEEVMQFLEKMAESEDASGYFVSPLGNVQLKMANGVITFQYGWKGGCPLAFLKLFYTMNPEEFCYFLQEKGLEGRLEYEKVKYGLEGLMTKLKKTGLVEVVYEKKMHSYFLEGKLIGWYRDERGWESNIVKEYENLIYDTFDRVKGDGSSSREDIKTLSLELQYQ